MPIFLLLLLVPIIEIALFIKVGGLIGLWPTLAIVILTAMAGTALLRAQGLAALGELQHELNRGGNPAPALAHGALILVAGILLLTPGFFTDTLGFLLLVPPLRAAVIRALAKRMIVVGGRKHGPQDGGPGAGPGGDPGTVEGEYTVVEPDEDGSSKTGGKTESKTGGKGSSGWTRLSD